MRKMLISLNKLPKKKLILLFVIVLIAFIWIHSMLPSNESAKESNWFTSFIINPILRLLGLSVSDKLVRKLAHVTEYLVLSLLVTVFFEGKALKSIQTGFLVAFIDETIQILSSRGPRIADVWIDMIGVTLGYIISALLIRLKNKKKNGLSSRSKKTTEGET